MYMDLVVYRYIGRKIAEADARLFSIRPPDCITRIPRSFRGRAWKGMCHLHV